MIWPSVPAGDTPQDSRARHTNPVIAYTVAEILSCSTVFCQSHAVDSPNSAETLPLFYSEPHIQVSVHPHHETDRWQLHRHSTSKGRRTAWKPIWQQGRAGMRDCERDSGTAELCRKKAAIKRTGVCSRGSLRVCPVSLWMWVWIEYWLQCIRSHDGCVYLLYTSLLNFTD